MRIYFELMSIMNAPKRLFGLIALIASTLASCAHSIKIDYPSDNEALSACIDKSRSAVEDMTSGQGPLGNTLRPGDEEYLKVKQIYCRKSNSLNPSIGIYKGYVDYEEKMFDEDKITLKTMELPPFGLTYRK